MQQTTLFLLLSLQRMGHQLVIEVLGRDFKFHFATNDDRFAFADALGIICHHLFQSLAELVVLELAALLAV
jgi:hypothetical protein